MKSKLIIRSIRNSHKGFTLVEMLVIVSIMVLITTISIAQFRAGEKRRRVNLAADTATNAVRIAQNLTLAAKQIEGTNCNQGKAPKSYIIDFTASKTIDLYAIDKCDGYTFLGNHPLPGNTRIRSDGYRLNSASVPALQIKFTPPFGAITISSSSSLNQGPFNSFTTGAIIVESNDGAVSRTVTVDGVSGKIGE